MKDNAKSNKISLIISMASIVICLVAVLISVINLRYTIINENDAASGIVLFCCTLSILCANITIFLTNYIKYKKYSK